MNSKEIIEALKNEPLSAAAMGCLRAFLDDYEKTIKERNEAEAARKELESEQVQHIEIIHDMANKEITAERARSAKLVVALNEYMAYTHIYLGTEKKIELENKAMAALKDSPTESIEIELLRKEVEAVRDAVWGLNYGSEDFHKNMRKADEARDARLKLTSTTESGEKK